MLRRIGRVLITMYCWHVVLNCAFASLVVGMPLALLVPRRFDPQRRLPHRVGTFFWGTMVWSLVPFWRLEIEGADRLRAGGPYLVVSNHQSLLDVLVLMALRADFKWVSGLRFFKIPLFADYMRVTGYIAADLGNPFGASAVLDQCRSWLAQGVSIGLFPEGTRSADGSLGPFKPGAFRVAVEEGLAVLPIAIEGSRAILPKHGWTYRDSPFARVRVRVLDPVRLEDLPEPTAAALGKAARAAIGQTLDGWRA